MRYERDGYSVDEDDALNVAEIQLHVFNVVEQGILLRASVEHQLPPVSFGVVDLEEE